MNYLGAASILIFITSLISSLFVYLNYPRTTLKKSGAYCRSPLPFGQSDFLKQLSARKELKFYIGTRFLY
ncbi:MAG TPA: hypothetical protein DD723_08485 [Candidatus Omnitrophica bacterium]|nr:MAG: hypothetical protein A2Z81_00025 [Omnitrophica WOR_2 bacterium GWA2_45_18]HBR15556.1 hypothetical protein [Candidatus Omnitrophota bacterium]